MNTTTIPSDSPINEESLETQNARLLRYLESGRTINFMQAMKIGINHLHSRIPNLKDAGIAIYSRMVKVGHIDCREYSINPFTNDKKQDNA